MLSFFEILLFFSCLFILEKATEHEQGRGRETEGDTESEADSKLWAVSMEPNVGLELTNHDIMTGAEVGRLTEWATQEPPFFEIFIVISWLDEAYAF